MSFKEYANTSGKNIAESGGLSRPRHTRLEALHLMPKTGMICSYSILFYRPKDFETLFGNSTEYGL